MSSDSSLPEAPGSTPPDSASDVDDEMPIDRDRRLVAAWRGGDNDKGQELMDHYHGYYLSLCWRYGIRSEDEQLDLFQELLVRLLKVVPKLELESSFAGYLRRVFHTTVRETRSRGHHAPLHEGIPSQDADPDQSVRDQEIVAAIEECSEGLSDRERQVFTARVLRERAFTEIAELLDVSINNLHVIYHRVRSKMRRCLDQKGFQV